MSAERDAHHLAQEFKHLDFLRRYALRVRKIPRIQNVSSIPCGKTESKITN
jgi:hypothetical protein